MSAGEREAALAGVQRAQRRANSGLFDMDGFADDFASAVRALA